MKDNHWIHYITNPMAVKSIYNHEDIPDLHQIIIENILLGFNLNYMNIIFHLPFPSHPPKKFIEKKYNIIYGKISISDIESLKIEKKTVYTSKENYNLYFSHINGNICIKISGSLSTNILITARFVSLLDLKGGHIE